MKKFLLFILTLMYMGVSSGIAMEIHYCMGKRAGIDFYKTKDGACSRCGMKEKKSGCCHDVHQFHKLKDSHKNVSNDLVFEAGDIAIIAGQPIYSWLIPITDETAFVPHHAPPRWPGPSACIMNCIFRL